MAIVSVPKVLRLPLNRGFLHYFPNTFVSELLFLEEWIPEKSERENEWKETTQNCKVSKD